MAFFLVKYSTQIPFRSVVIQVVLCRPVLVFNWGEDGTVEKGQDVAGQVLFDLDPFRNQHFIFSADTHQAFIKGPVAEAAEGKAVCGQVVVALAPWLDVRSLDNRVAVGCEHPDSAQGTAVIVYRYNCFPEPLVSNPGLGTRCQKASLSRRGNG
jgi:hypothetical protein